MEQVQQPKQLDILKRNADIRVPLEQLPPNKTNDIKIKCKNLDHRDQYIKYLVVQKDDTGIGETRLICEKCLFSNKSHLRDHIAILDELYEDPLNVYKYTNYQNNIVQEFISLYQKFEFQRDKNLILLEINQIEESIKYYINQLKINLLEHHEKYLQVKNQFERPLKEFEKIVNFSNVTKQLKIFQQLGASPTPKDWNKLNDEIKKYVEGLTQESNTNYTNDLKRLKDDLAKEEHLLLLQKYKIQQGKEKIINTINEMENAISEYKFKKSEISNDYIQTILERIHPTLSNFVTINDKIQLLYSSIKSGLYYREIVERLKQIHDKLLFIFSTNSGHIFGAYAANLPEKSFLFQLNKGQIYPINNDGIQKVSTNQSNGNPGTPGILQQPSAGRAVGMSPVPTGGPPTGPPPGTRLTVINGQPQPNNNREQSSQGQPPSRVIVKINRDPNDNCELFEFGNGDLTIRSNFKGNKSNLGRGCDISEYKIANAQMHLANAEEFDIVGLEIFQVNLE